MTVLGFHRFCILLCMSVLLLVPQTSAAEMVRVTGRAALEAGKDTLVRRRALEDALYQASLAGGAEVDGFSLADQGVLAGEAVLLRPSSRILDFAVLREQKASSHYEVTIEAYVGTQPDLGCSVRPDVVLTAVRPQVYASAKTPLWMKDALLLAHEETLAVLSGAAKTKITQSDISMRAVRAQPSVKVQSNFDYQTLLAGGATASQSGPTKLPENTRALELKWVADGMSMRARSVNVTLDARIIDAAAPSRGRTVRVTHKLKISPDTPWRALNVVSRKDQQGAAAELSEKMGAGVVPLLEQFACAPLVAPLQAAGKDRFRVELGARDGLTRQSLAFVEGRGQMWSVLRVVELAQSSAIVKPMNTARAGQNLLGASVRFNVGRP
ncbi:MAG: flagellar assembly protein T N-terminal domain-containing protein [Planktotalea arctica]